MFDSHEPATPAYQKLNAAEYSMDDLLWFLRVAQAGSLSGAATQLGVPKSTLSRRLSRMEAVMGVVLVHRNSRSFRLTDIGARLVEQATPMVQQLEQMTGDILSRKSNAAGSVRFSASGSFGRLVIVPLVTTYLLQHSDVRVDIELTDRKVNVIKEGFDFAVRIGELPDSGLRLRKLCKVGRVLCASPEYARRYGLPAKPEDLAAHACLVQSKNSARIELQASSRRVAVVLPARLIAGPSDNLLHPVMMGLGISPLPEIQVAAQLHRKELLRVLPDWDMPEFDVQLLYPAQRHAAPATRALMDHFAAGIPGAVTKLLDAR
jgi:DNA-binding transcriptional LysR family regulator